MFLILPFLILLNLFTLLEAGTSDFAFFLLSQTALLFGLSIFFKKIRPSPLLITLWVIFLSSQLLSFVTSISPNRSIKSLLISFSYCFYFFTTLSLVNKKNFKIFLFGLFLNGLLLSLLSYFYLLPGIKKPATALNLVYATFGHSHLADLLLLILPLSLAYFLEKKKKVFLLALVFLLLSFLLTFSRAAFLGLVTSLAFFWWQTRNQVKLVKCFSWLLFILPLLWLAGSFYYAKTHPLSPGKSPNNWLERQTLKPLGTKRLEYFRQSLVIFKNSPVLGSGPGTFYLGSLRYQKLPLSWSWFSHNQLLQTLSESGLLGFLGFTSLLSFLLFKNYRIIKKENNLYLTGLYSGLLGSSLHSLVDFDWQLPAVFLWFWVINALIFSFNQEKKSWPKTALMPVFLVFTTLNLFLLSGKFFTKDPYYYKLYEDRADKLVQEKNLDEAWKNYQKALELNPLDSPLLYQKQAGLAEDLPQKIKILNGYYQKTSSYTWQDFGAKTKEISRLYYQLASLYYQDKQLEKAKLVLFKTLDEVDNWEIDYYSLLGKVLKEQGKETAYLKYEKICLQQLPGEPRCLLN